LAFLFISLIFFIGLHKFNEKKITHYIAKNHPKLFNQMGGDYPSQENLMPSQKAIYWKLIWGSLDETNSDPELKSICARDKVVQIIAVVNMLVLLIVFIANVT